MSVDLSQLSISELAEVARKAEELAQQKHREGRDSARAELKQIANYRGYTIFELFGATVMPAGKSRKAKSAPKYANPADASQTWTGRGKPPNWYREALAGGTPPGSMLIQGGA